MGREPKTHPIAPKEGTWVFEAALLSKRQILLAERLGSEDGSPAGEGGRWRYHLQQRGGSRLSLRVHIKGTWYWGLLTRDVLCYSGIMRWFFLTYSKNTISVRNSVKVGLARWFSWLKCLSHAPRFQVWFLVRVHAGSSQWMHGWVDWWINFSLSFSLSKIYP